MLTHVSVPLTKLETGVEAQPICRETQSLAQSGTAKCPFGLPFGERRRNPRCSFTAAVSVLEPASGLHIEGHTTDLSPGGCFVDTTNSFPPGTKVHLCMTKKGESVEADAVVACSEVGVGMGLTLTTIASGHRAVLDHWFAELRGEVDPARHALDDIEVVRASNTPKTKTDYLLEELVAVLMRKGLLNAEEGDSILRRSPTTILDAGDKIHIIHRQLFDRDVQRHFVGIVETCEGSLAKVKGYLFARDTQSNQFVRHDQEARTRIVALNSDMLIINVLPPHVDTEKITYKRHVGQEVTVTDGSDWHLELSHL
jgi:hypothetical protein